MPPIVKYGYSISATAEPVDSIDDLALVAKGWEPQLTPQQVKELNGISSLVYYHGSIWMIANPYYSQIARFDPQERQLEYYSNKIDAQSEFRPWGLFITSDRKLWGIGDPAWDKAHRVILSTYEPLLNHFQPMLDQSSLLLDAITLGNIRVDDDSLGNLWIVLPDNTVARFDPKTRKAEIVLDHKDGYLFSQIAVAPDGKIWLSTEPEGTTSTGKADSSSELVQFDPGLNKLRSFGVPPDWEGRTMSFQPYIDRRGRVWAGGEWLDKTIGGDYEWFALSPQPEFVSLRHNTLSEVTIPKYSVGSPWLVLDASDESMWFRRGGILRLDLESGEWCRVTEGRPIYEIIEDDEGQLWMTDLNQLYKKRLAP